MYTITTVCRIYNYYIYITDIYIYCIIYIQYILYNLCTGGNHVRNVPEGILCTVYAPEGTTTNIYIIYKSLCTHLLVVVTDHLDTILTGTHQSLYCTCVVCTVWRSVPSFTRRGLPCLLINY